APPAQGPQLAFSLTADEVTIEANGTVCDPGRARQQPQRRQRQRALAAARFAYQAQRLSRSEREFDAFDGKDLAFLRAIDDRDIFELEKCPHALAQPRTGQLLVLTADEKHGDDKQGEAEARRDRPPPGLTNRAGNIGEIQHLAPTD